jgi:hypothetical protein
LPIPGHDASKSQSLVIKLLSTFIACGFIIHSP